MKVKKLIQAMWLPGFEPEADPLQVLGAIECAPKEKATTTWPTISPEFFAGLESPVEKFLANVAAIKLLRELESCGKAPSSGEFRVLSRYTGWGGLPQAFNLDADGKWRARAEELRALLEDAEWQSARDSTPNAHYTSIEVIEAMWAMARRMGFEGGSILEPSAGVGYFIGAMPEVLRNGSSVTMVELDSISARIARTLYEPYGIRVIASGFESAQFAESSFDLAIGNVPFGNYKVAEKRNVPFKDFTIHNYFVARALEVVRPGGIVMFITSSFTLDAANDAVRRYLAQQAELIAAIRLPSTTFAKIANTRVTTDIIILKKRATPKVHVDEVWVESVWLPAESPLNTAGVPLRVNRWFAENPQWVIGKLALTDNGYAKSTGCVFDGDLAEELARRVEWLPEGVFNNSNAATFVSTQVTDLPPGYHVIDGDVVEVIDGRAVKVQASGKTLERIRGLIEVRDAARKLVAAQAQLDDETKVGVFRVALNATYDAFVQKYGYINASANRRAFKNDPALPLLLSLEHWDEETETAEKADIFFRRTVGVPHVVESADSPQEALLITLAESGGVMLPHRIAELLGKSEEEAMQALETIGAVFLDPESNQWVTADQYLSGNVRHKLAVAKTAGERFAHNVTALEAVLPKDLAPSEIDVRLGASWIPTDVYEDFINELLECTENKVEFNEQAGAFNVEPDYRTRWSVLATRAYGTSEVNAITLFEQALNQQVPTVKKKDYVQDKYVVDQQATIAAREKQQAIKDRFAQWVWADEFRAARLVRLYNERFNSVIPRKFDGSHLVLKGFSSVYTLRPHQKDAIWRIVASGKNTLLAHVVGAGKTLVMICAAMELRRVGKATKPMIVVPNHMLEQVSREFLMAYPSANVLMVSKNDLSGDKRRQFCARIATGDWDAVIITHSSFERIKMSDDFMRSYILDEIARIEEALEEYAHSSNRGNRIVKELARARKAWEARLTSLAREDKKDDLLSFEELGVDWLFIDEAHLFKNLWRFSKMERIAGLPNSNSERAFDMFVKTRYIMQKRGDDTGVVFATGTPVANSMAEMWVMQRYLQPGTLQRHGVDMFDTWAATFGEAVTALELAPDGSGYRMQTRFARFTNLPELLNMFREVADVRTAEMLDLPVPQVRYQTVTAQSTEALKQYVATLVERAEAIRGGRVSPREDNMLAVTNDGRKAALDMRLVDPDAADDPNGKVALCARNVADEWVRALDTKGTQIVFCDLSTPKADGSFSVYHDLRKKLVELGIPAAEIAFIHDYESDAAKAELFKAVREGRVRVLIGSTSKMGVGTNVQTRLVALHHLDAPWRPADVEQREGRIIRQGNLNEEVRIYRYVTEGSFDAYIWQTLETKARFIAQVMKGENGLRCAEDVELAALSYAEVKALASGNPLVLEKAQVDTELAKLAVLKNQWEQQTWQTRQEIAALPQRISYASRRIAHIVKDLAHVESLSPEQYTFAIGDMTTSDANKAANALLQAVRAIRFEAHEFKVGEYAGFEIIAQRSGLYMHLTLRREAAYSVGRLETGIGAVRNIIALVNGLSAVLAEQQAQTEALTKRLDDLRAAVNQPFEHEERLQWLRKRQAELAVELGITEGDIAAVDTEDAVSA